MQDAQIHDSHVTGRLVWLTGMSAIVSQAARKRGFQDQIDRGIAEM